MPRRIVCLDSESYQQQTEYATEHTFRLACAAYDALDATARPVATTERISTEDSLGLWRWVDSKTSPTHRLVVFAHNMAFDVRLTGAFVALANLGWECKGVALNSYGFWARWKNDKRGLWLCDSLSFLPVSLEKLGGALNLQKPPLPTDDAPQEEWLYRCSEDVSILREAMLKTLAYLHDNKCGDFRLTGAAQGFACFRHRFLPERAILSHKNGEALQAERRASFCGRAEVFRYGKIGGRLYEYDYEYAYARLAESYEVPTKLVASHSPLEGQRLANLRSKYAVLADVVVKTDAPCVPCKGESHIVWPVGEFVSTLWDIELDLITESGGSYEVKRLWYYQRSPVLRSWAKWIMGELDKQSDELDPVPRIMLKDWSRSMIGRFGLRYPLMDEIATMPTSDFCVRPTVNADTGGMEERLQIGRQLFDRTEKVESPSSVPAIMSYIMAAGRVRMWETLTKIWIGGAIYCDTDGVIVNDKGAKSLDWLIGCGELQGLRRKFQFAGGDFRAPRNIDLGETRRVNGAPRRAERLTNSVYRGEVWESIEAALGRRKLDSVFVHDRTFNVSDSDPRRIHLPDGSTAPLALRTDGYRNFVDGT